MDNLSGSVERITYYNEENGYTVLRLRPEKKLHVPGLSRDGLATVVGNLPELSPGEHLDLQGRWHAHPKHGLQFNAEICEQTLPATASGIERYLGSGMIKGIGPRLAERIVEHFKADTLTIIEESPEKLRQVSGIGADRTAKINAAWQTQKQVKEIMIFLHGHGISTNLAIKIYKTYGDTALDTVQANPYQLERDIYGVGFKTADKVAQQLGLAKTHPSRIEAGLVFALNEMTNNGHVYSPREQLAQRAAELLEVDIGLIPAALDRLTEDGRIRPEVLPDENAPGQGLIAEQQAAYGAPVIYLTPFYFGEKGVAERIDKLMGYTVNAAQLPQPNDSLSPEQQNAVTMALTNPVSILTGGPGTGKTTCMKALIEALEWQKKSYLLASPTGRAAKRLSETTGRSASTIHRLLGFSPVEGFTYNEDNPLKTDFVVVDEASMLDLLLTNNLLKALSPGTHLLFSGDIDQLPAVGAGDVLRDMIASGQIPVTRLTTIFRQAADSQIITNAHRINAGQMPIFAKDEGQFYLFPADDALAAADWVVDVVTERIPQKFGFDPVQDIQVLSPMYRGAAGVQALNQRLQEKLNPPKASKPERQLYGTIFRPGDKVMQTRNNYDKDVYNGDIGFVRKIDMVEQQLRIDFDGRLVPYEWDEADELILAYAVSVHKSQGSEFPVVVIPVVTQHYMMLQRNLLYTAVTRAKKLCVLAGSKRAIGMAVGNNKVAKRFSALDLRLK
ncbi:MAG: ATP-dependent RecD-like DNA helicase [Anaerolineae bacterium]|jgi:exodeoxyribonuclease V alpha subunit|nr:ATP-dependent RecD-like DNA helicase [Anaerolineae bacterium]